MAAINEGTGEMKYFLSNATTASVTRVLAVAFRRCTVEHWFRLGKQEAGLMGYEGRNYTGLIRHLTPSLIVLGFVATRTERLRGGKLAPTAEQVCRARNQRCQAVFRRQRGVPEVRHTSDVIRYHQKRNTQAAKSHKKQRHKCII